MNRRKEIQEELRQIAPSLQEFQGKGDGFVAPEGYFDRLGDEIWQQINPGRKTRKVHPLRLLFRFPYPAGIAAAIALVVAAVFWLNKPQPGISELTELTPQEAQQYILNHIEDFDLSLLVGIHNDSPLPETPDPADTLDRELEQLLDEYLEDVDEAELEQLLF